MKRTNLLSWFGYVASLEGLSYILVFINMLIVKRVNPALGEQLLFSLGMAHGVLFILYVLMALQCKLRYDWSWQRLLWYLFLSIVPFGTFWVDAKVRQEKKARNTVV